MRHHPPFLFVILALGSVHSAAQRAAPAVDPRELLPAPAPLPARPQVPRVDASTPAGAAAGALDRRLTPTRFDIEGVGALPFAQVAQLFAPLANRPVTVGTLAAAARQASERYRAAGYPLSFVYLPQQDFAGGVVRVVAVEGHVASLRIEGEAGGAEARLREMAQPLLAQRPLRLETFERATQLMAQLPGLSVQAEAAMPTTTDGAVPLTLKVRRQPYNLSLGADLREPTSRALLTGRVGDLLASGSDLSASMLVGDFSREAFGSVAYTQFVGGDGLAWKTSYSQYRGYPDEAMAPGAPVERLNHNRRLEFSASYPLLLDARRSLVLRGGLYGVDNQDDYRVRANGVRLTDDSRVRAAFAQLAWQEATPRRARSASALLARGIDGLGARSTLNSNVTALSGPGPARLDFTRLALDASQRDRFANRWGTAVSAGGQLSSGPLAASERVSFGGSRFGRGYAAGDAAGDSGWGVGAELNRLFPLDMRWLKSVEPYLLLEAARVYTRVDQPAPRDLGSVALGLRLSDARHYSLDLALAKPVGDAALSNPGREPRLSLLLSYQLDAP